MIVNYMQDLLSMWFVYVTLGLIPVLANYITIAVVKKYIAGVPYTLAKLAICYCILHFGY